MAGDWIKMRTNLRTSPKVARISSALKADRLRVIGGLHAVWCLFDEHSADGFLDGYTVDTLDDELRWPGFAAAMIAVEWLEDGGDSLSTPRFDEHNGQSAKRRCQESERKRNERKASAEPSASDADKKRSREEKRREEKEPTTTTSSSGDDLRACPVGSLVDIYHECMPANPQVRVLNEARKGAIRQRWREAAAMTCEPFGYKTKEEGLEAWRKFFKVCADSDFLTGRAPASQGKPPFIADIEFLFSPSGFAKILENKYHRGTA